MKLSKEAKEYLLDDAYSNLTFYLDEIKRVEKYDISVEAKINIKEMMQKKINMFQEILREVRK